MAFYIALLAPGPQAAAAERKQFKVDGARRGVTVQGLKSLRQSESKRKEGGCNDVIV